MVYKHSRHMAAVERLPNCLAEYLNPRLGSAVTFFGY